MDQKFSVLFAIVLVFGAVLVSISEGRFTFNLHRAPPSSRCNSTSQCHSVNATCDRHLCNCKPGYGNAGHGKCAQPVALNKTCKSDDGCLAANFGSYCVQRNHTCQCKPGYYVSFSKCYASGSPNGGKCSSLNDCHRVDKHSSCNHGSCGCSNGYNLTGSGCELLPARLKEICFVSQQCSAYDPNSQCTGGRCDCLGGYNYTVVPRSDYSYCSFTKTAINGTCTSDAECRHNDKNSRCLVFAKGKHCGCPKGYNAKKKVCNFCSPMIPQISLITIAIAYFFYTSFESKF